MKTRLFIFIALAVDILIALSKFIAAAITGSASMVSEGIHSVIDAISQVLLIWGMKVSRRHADEARPFGYGRELYFWSFIVSLVIFISGGCFSVYEGISRFKKPELMGNPIWNYLILGIAFIFTLVSLTSAFQAFNKQRKNLPFWRAIFDSKDPSTLIVLLGDIGDILGLIIAFLGIFLGRLFHNPYFDGTASILIGLILIFISLLLARESKSLLLGESPSRKTLRKIILLTESDAAILKVKKHLSMYLAPEEIVLQLIAVFKEDLTTAQITDAIDRVTRKIQQEFPLIKQIFIEPARK